MAFSESPRFPDDISQGSSGGPRYNTQIVSTQAGYEDRRILWTSVRHQYNAAYAVRSDSDIYDVLQFFHAMNGRAHEFRFKDWSDYKSGSVASAVTAIDQSIGSGNGVTAAFQLVKNYTSGLIYQRTIKKPVTGSVRVSIDDDEQAGNWTVDTATGIITIENIVKTITSAVSSGANTVLTSNAHGLVAGDSAYLSTFTGAWAGLNAARYYVASVTTNTFTIAHDSSGYAAYSANGGQLSTLPQTGETVKAGFEFDVPCRFDTDNMDVNLENYLTGSTDLPIIEVRL